MLKWKWVNGDPITYINWTDGELNDMRNCGEGVGIMNWSFSGKWNDLSPCSPEWFKVCRAIIESDD
jgi:hypothetical protein